MHAESLDAVYYNDKQFYCKRPDQTGEHAHSKILTFLLAVKFLVLPEMVQ